MNLRITSLALLLSLSHWGYAGTALPHPVLFVTQMPISREVNGSVSNTFVSVVSLFGNHTADTARAGRGGDLWLLHTNGGLVNLTRRGGYGISGAQHTNGIAVRDPQVHWSGAKAIFSMVVGAPRYAGDSTPWFWQMYEVTNLAAIVADTNVIPGIVRVLSQPTNCNNVNPCYGTDGRIIFASDQPYAGQGHLYPARDEYKGAPTVTGLYSLDPGSGDLKMLTHTPSGAFNPILDSFGRVIFTRWDHLVVDSNSTDDRLGRATNGSLNFASEAAAAAILPAVPETFPEPRNYDTVALAQQGVHGNAFNFFFPWMLPEQGGSEELLNHAGRHELSQSINTTFLNDADLVAFTDPANREAFAIQSANTNFFGNFFQIAEDPLHPGRYFGVDAPDFSAQGGTHTAGQIITLTGGAGLNPTGMVVNYITPKSTAAPNSLGVFRNPLPMSDGSLLACFTPATSTDTNLGTITAPQPAYHFRLVRLAPNGATWTTNAILTPGITNPASYWDGTTLVGYSGAMWELQPVEVRARPVPAAWNPGVDPIEAGVFAQEGVDLATFQSDLSSRKLALVVSRNVTARDAADKQQPFNLRVPGGVQSIVPNSKTNYDITHLQFMEADYLRGYDFGTVLVQPGRRVLATPLHGLESYNYPSIYGNAPAGGTAVMPDGSQATLVPANRALTWQLTGTNNQSLVKERYWINFRPGEVRTCANCHGINDRDQLGRPAPTNPAQALHELLRLWKTNALTGYQLTVSQGSGSGTYGAGTILSLTAQAPAPGKTFAFWSGPGVSNPTAASCAFTMPASNAVVSAVFTNLPAIRMVSVQTGPPGQVLVSSRSVPGETCVLQSSVDLSVWNSIRTNAADSAGNVGWIIPIDPQQPLLFYRAIYP